MFIHYLYHLNTLKTTIYGMHNTIFYNKSKPDSLIFTMPFFYCWLLTLKYPINFYLIERTKLIIAAVILKVDHVAFFEISIHSLDLNVEIWTYNNGYIYCTM